ncbi:hypothetical protein AAEX28_14170 [Lentisphaerota bacterium WC36G]|nr:hypothetical protein LJT99_00920 [Lentisphaerae bacterium WC36]
MNNIIELQNNNYSLSSAPSNGVPLKFTFLKDNKKSIQMMISPVRLGAFGENAGIVKKLRSHESMDGLTHSIEMLNIIPFGPEPKVGRNINFAKNHAKVVTDVELKSSLPVKKVHVDNLLLSGDIVEFAVVTEENYAANNYKWQKIRDISDDGVIFKDDKPFLIFIVKNSNNDTFEVGTGDDLWRWKTACDLEHISSEFKITSDANGSIKIERLVLDLSVNSEATLESRNWRFKWYFAWQEAENSQTKDNEYSQLLRDALVLNSKANSSEIKNFDGFEISFKFTADSIDNAAFCSAENDKKTKTVCFEAPATIKFLRKWLRSVIANVNKNVESINLIIEGSQLCYNASHLSRGVMDKLEHLDVNSKMDFWLWANKQCAKNDLKFKMTILDDNNHLYKYNVVKDFAQGC